MQKKIKESKLLVNKTNQGEAKCRNRLLKNQQNRIYRMDGL